MVPEIEASPAYKEGGLIAITSPQAPQAGPHARRQLLLRHPGLSEPARPDAAHRHRTGPVKPTGGGGQVGLLLISPFVAPGTVNESGYFNHYSLLFSIEELFGLERLGYASEEALTAFDSTVFNAERKRAAPASKRAFQSSRISTAVSRPRAMPLAARALDTQRGGR